MMCINTVTINLGASYITLIISFSVLFMNKTTALDFCHEIFPVLSILKNSQILRQKLPVWLSFVKRNGDQESVVCGNL